MPRYFITAVDGQTTLEGVGVDLCDLIAARAMAFRYASDLLREFADRAFEEDLHVQVSDETGLMLFTITTIAVDAPVLRR